jgi:transcriptional accessory protein Tex/SPT6
MDRKQFPAPDEAQIIREALSIATIISIESGRIEDIQPMFHDHPLVNAIAHVLRFIRYENLEIPFIARHRKDYFYPQLQVHDLWRVYDLDEKFLTIEMKKKSLKNAFEELRKVSVDAQQDDYALEQIKKIATLYDIADLQMYLQLHYGSNLSFLENSKSKLFKKPLWRVTYEGAKRNNLDTFAKVFLFFSFLKKD